MHVPSRKLLLQVLSDRNTPKGIVVDALSSAGSHSWLGSRIAAHLKHQMPAASAEVIDNYLARNGERVPIGEIYGPIETLDCQVGGRAWRNNLRVGGWRGECSAKRRATSGDSPDQLSRIFVRRNPSYALYRISTGWARWPWHLLSLCKDGVRLDKGGRDDGMDILVRNHSLQERAAVGQPLPGTPPR